MSIRIEKLSHEDARVFIELIQVFEDVFEMENFQMPEQNYLKELLKKDSFLVFVALIDEKVVGGLTSYILKQYYVKKPLLYVYDLAVKTKHQRQGIGKMLMSAVTYYSKEIGVEEVYIQADEIDQHAVDFYRSTGAIASRVINFSYPLSKDV